MPIEEVTDLLTRWRSSGGVWSRSRVVAEGAARVGRLSVDERRELATALADQGAPELADRLGSRLGEPLDPQQVRAVTEGLFSLDGERIDGLVSTLQDPEHLRALADDQLRELPPPLPTGGRADLPPPPERGASQPGEPAAEREPEAPRGTEPEREPEAAPGAEAVPRPEPEPEREAATAGPGVAAAARTPTVGIGPTLQRLQAADSASARTRALATLAGRRLTEAEAVRILDEVPDGWQRRRALRQLLEGGSLVDTPAETVVTRLGRASDRVFIAAAMLDTGHLHPADLPTLLPPATARRLAARRRS